MKRLGSVLLLLSLVTIFAGQALATSTTASRLPLVFEPNRGQAPAEVRYLLRGTTLGGEFRADGITLSLPAPKGSVSQVNMRLVKSRKGVAPQGAKTLEGHTNYLLGNDPSLWLHDLPNYSQVRYSDVYPGTDLVFYGNGQTLEHDFEVSPGGEPSRIAMRFSDKENLSLAANGDLEIKLQTGTITFKRPVAYQVMADGRHKVDADFRLDRDGTVRFRIGHYDSSRRLVIDPVLSYATYLDTYADEIASTATDVQGNTYIAGLTFSASFPVTQGAFQTNCTSCANNAPAVFITKLNATGTAQIYSTFLGGSSYNQPFGIAVDPSGNAIVTGYTQSTDFPMKNPVSTVSASNGGDFAFISSLSADGSALNYSSLLGGGSTIGNGIAVDKQGNAYITGNTDSPNFPVTSGALNNAAAQYPEFVVFVSKFSSAGALGYSALLGDATPQGGGGGLIGSESIAVDSEGSAYITGGAGTLWPTTSGAYATQLSSAPFRAVFVAKLAPDGSQLKYSTFIGAGGGVSVALDSAENAFVAGNYDTTDYPVTSNAYISKATECCSFFSKISADGSQLLYSSFFGGSQNTGLTTIDAVTLDSQDNIFLAGSTQDSSFPLINPLAGQLPTSTLGSSSTSFLSEFDPTATKLNFSTFMGDLSGSGLRIALDAKGKVHAAGTTVSPIYTSPGAFLGTVPPPPQNTEYTYPYAELIDLSQAAPALCVNAGSQGLSYGSLIPGQSGSQSVSVTNCGNAPLSISSIVSSNAAFSVPLASNGCTNSIAAGGSCTATVVFAPTAVQTYAGQLTITSNSSIPTVSLPLSGSGAQPVASFNGNANVSFESELIGQTSPVSIAVLYNNGPVSLTIDQSKVSVTGDFAIVPGGCGATLPANASCAFLLTFTPTAAGTRAGVLSVPSNDPVNPVVTASLSATGFAGYPVPTVTALLNPSYPINSATAPISVGVLGTNFFPASVVYVNGSAQPTTYGSDTSLRVTLDPTLLKTAGSIPVTVVNPAPGGGTSAPYALICYISVPMAASALAIDPVGGLLYAAIPASAKQNPSTIVPINPATGVTMTPVAVSADPTKLAISDDGTELYVATSAGVLQRLNLKTLAIEKTYKFPVDSEWGQTYAQEMHVVPGSAKSIVVALFANVDPAEDGAALYDDAGLVNWLQGVNARPSLSIDSFTFVSPTSIYALPVGSTFFTNVQVSASGISGTGGAGGQFNQQTGSILRSDGNLLYTNSGEVWNPSTQKLLGTYLETNGSQLFYTQSVLPDTSNSRTYFLDGDGQYVDYQATNIDVFDQTSYALLGTVPFTTIFSPDAADLVRWGSNGFAFRVFDNTYSNPSANQIVIVTSSLIGTTTGAPVPIITSVSPAQVVAGGSSFSLQVTGSGFTNASTVTVNGSIRATTFVSGTSLAAQILASDIAESGQLNVQVATPSPGGGTSNEATVSVTAPPQKTPTIMVTPSSTNITTAKSLSVGVVVNGGTGSATPTGSIALSSGTYTSGAVTMSNGSATVTIPAGALTVGSDVITAVYTPDTASMSLYKSVTQTATVSVTAPVGSTSPTLMISPSTTTITDQETLPVAVTISGVSGKASPSGTVTLASGLYSAQQVLSGSAASFNIPAGTLSAGMNTLTANYSGDATYAPGTSTTTVTVSQVVITAAAPAPVIAGSTATANIALAAGSGYSGTLNLTCALASSPVGAQSPPTCSLNPASATIASGGSATAVLTIRTTAASVTDMRQKSRKNLFGFGEGGTVLGALFLLLKPRRRGRWRGLLAAVCVLVTVASIGCSSGGSNAAPPTNPGIPATTAGNYTFTLTGADASNSATTFTTNVIFKVE